MDYISRIRKSLPTNPFTTPSQGAQFDPAYPKLVPFYQIKSMSPGTLFKRALNNQLCFINSSGNAIDKDTRTPVAVGDNEQVFVSNDTFNNLSNPTGYSGGKRKTRKNKKSKKSRKPRRKSTYRRRH